MADALDAWLKAGNYLPDVLRDFHDQKEVFKAMHDLQRPADPSDTLTAGHYSLSFVTGQCYVIDRFLWFMAKRGYTLQRSRARLPFRDLEADVRAATEKRDAHEMALLEAHVSGVAAHPAPSAQGPAELWLQLHGDCHDSELTEPVDYTSDDVTWCWHPIHNTDIRYVRADLAGNAGVDMPGEVKHGD
jgi:hypothetical protein